ncbi:MAG: hypothetical protein WC757_03460 [Candidatus Paceibacterota bacterium]|jgi:hypothetical protein
MRNLLLLIVFAGSIFSGGFFVHASTTDGTIDPVHKTAYFLNSSAGAINLGVATGNIHVTDNELTGNAWSEMYGWINLNPTSGGVTNYNGTGVLSGYAWGERLGWINFKPTNGGVTIDANGYFRGYAWSQKLGWISFNCDGEAVCGANTYHVRTDWRPVAPVCILGALPANTTACPAGAGRGTWASVGTNSSSCTGAPCEYFANSNDDRGGPGSVVVVGISPNAGNISPGSTIQFSATVSGTSNMDVTWSITEAGGGTINSSGLYTAPSMVGIYHVVATSVADTSKSATATITVQAPEGITVVVTPSAISIPVGGQISLSASVMGTTSQAVVWSVEGGFSSGIITPLGVYTAPTTTGIYRVFAQSVADSSQIGIATITVTPEIVAPEIVISPITATIRVGETLQLSAQIVGDEDGDVTWSVRGQNSGAVSATGVYTAPNILGVYEVVATDATNPLVFAVATITVNPALSIIVSISPSSIDVNPGSQTVFSVDVSGTSNTEVVWSVQESGCGSISSGGVYTAKTVVGICHVIATSVADLSVSAIATISISEPFSVCTGEDCGDSGIPPEDDDGDGRESTTTPAVIVKEITKSVDFIASTTVQVVGAVQKIVETPIGNTVTRTVSTVGVVATGAAASSALFLNPLSFSELFMIPFRLWTLLMTALGLRKRFRPWGTVYDSVTKQPLDPAYVVLMDKQGNEVLTSITDLDGRYGFLSSAPGVYTIVANKTNYIFPSTKLAGRTSDELYSNLYFGDDLTITAEQSFIDKNIPLDPEHFDWNEYAKQDKGLLKFHSRRDRFFRRFTDWSFRVGFIVAIIALIAIPQPYNLIICGLYVLLAILRFLGIKPRAYGLITEKITGNPISFAIIRIMSPSLNREIFHRVTDKLGRYYCLLPKGEYFLNIEKKNDDGSYSLIFTSPVINAKNGVIKNDYKI